MQLSVGGAAFVPHAVHVLPLQLVHHKTRGAGLLKPLVRSLPGIRQRVLPHHYAALRAGHWVVAAVSAIHLARPALCLDKAAVAAAARLHLALSAHTGLATAATTESAHGKALCRISQLQHVEAYICTELLLVLSSKHSAA